MEMSRYGKYMVKGIEEGGSAGLIGTAIAGTAMRHTSSGPGSILALLATSKRKRKRTDSLESVLLMSAPPYLPGRFQPSIVSTGELNCRVRDGNGCTLTAVGTDSLQGLRPELFSGLHPEN